MEGLETNNGNQISCLFFLVVTTLSIYISHVIQVLALKLFFVLFLNLLLDFQLLELWDFFVLFSSLLESFKTGSKHFDDDFKI